ncbi:hypothetical protein GCM10020256_16010 [Streptomyces thermocoprophilus]
MTEPFRLRAGTMPLAVAVLPLNRFAVMIVVGLVIGFRFVTGLLPPWAGLSLLFSGYAMSWIGAFVGMTTGSANAAQSSGCTRMPPLPLSPRRSPPTGSMPTGR